MLGKKKLFVSFAERKSDRQSRLKALFESMDKLALELRSEVAIKPEQPRSGTRPPSTAFGGLTTVKPVSGYRRGGVRRGRRLRRGQPGRRMPSEPYVDPSFVDIDFHEDFPPLPNPVKPNQSPTLQKLADTIATQSLHDPPSPSPSPKSDTRSQPAEFQSPQKAQSHDAESHNFGETLVHAPQLQADPPVYIMPLPHAPPPSSAEISTAGNTAPSSPSSKYTRPPRMTAQSLHDKLLFANATLATLQESPLLKAALGQSVAGDQMISLDTTAGAIPVEAALREEWVSPLRSHSAVV